MYSLERKIIIATTRTRAWEFFSDPRNLSFITPPEMGFVIRTPLQQGEFYEGMVIEYTVRPILGIPTRWISEIRSISPMKSFEDVQLKGPYATWTHSHIFNVVADGVEVYDRIEYAIPFGWLGKIAHSLFVRKKLERIFAYRAERIQFLFHQKSFRPNRYGNNEFITLN